jgi:hypothetical protein
MKIARVSPSVTMGQLAELCRKMRCVARDIDGHVWLFRAGPWSISAV